MTTTEENPPVPNWLLKLEEQREKRLKARLGHETGAGAPCQICEDKCSGLDLHFWRKICKVCKCKKEDHDINEDDIYGFVQFQLLGSKPTNAKSFFLNGHKDAVVLDWTPKGSNNDVKRYFDELPSNMLPVKGSEAAKLRKQRLQKQMPAHDIDASLCHALTEDEIKELEEYVAHIRKHSVGQGKVIQLSLLKGAKHQLPNANAQFLSQHAPNQLASSQTVSLQPSDISNNLLNYRKNSNTNLKKLHNRLDFLNSQIPQTPVTNSIDEQNPSLVNQSKDISHPIGCNRPAEKLKSLKPEDSNISVDNQNPVSVNAPKDLLSKPNLSSENFQNPIFDKNFALSTKDSENYIQHLIGLKQLEDAKFNKPAVSGGHVHDMYPDATENVNRLLSLWNQKGIQEIVENIGNPETFDQVFNVAFPNANQNIDNKNIQYPNDKFGGFHEDNKLLYSDYPNSKYKNQQHGASDPNQNQCGIKHPDVPYNYPLTTTNVEKHQEQFRNSNPMNANVHSASNYIYPIEEDREPYNPTMLDRQYPTRDTYGFPNDLYTDLHKPYGSKDSTGPTVDLKDLEAIQADKNTQYLPPRPYEQKPIPPGYPKDAKSHQNPMYKPKSNIQPAEDQHNLTSVGYIRDIVYPNQMNKPQEDSKKCHKCANIFDEDGIAISVERTENLWHPSCFKCATCEQPLVDLMYFYHKEKDDIYCGRDYALLKGIPRCAACDELIFVREYCLAEDHTFHIKHFCCFECDDPLAGKQYVMENNQPVCLPCYEKLKADKCNDCGFVISADQPGVSLQKIHWHADSKCFACKNCRKALLGGKMLLRKNNVFCSDVCFKSYHSSGIL